MEVAAAETTETNNVSLPEVAPKEEDVGVSDELKNSGCELTQSDKSVASDKELSWEKIAAEFTEEEEEEIIENVEENQTQIQEEPKVESGTMETAFVQETVINTVTEEKIITGSENASVETIHMETVVKETTVERQETESTSEPTFKENDNEILLPDDVNQESSKVSEQEQSISPEVPLTSDHSEVQYATPGEQIEEVQTAFEEVIEETTAPVTTEKAEELEISELKPEEVTEVTETLDGLEYTVVEAEEVETNEIIEEHIAQTNTETVVIINPDQSQTEITIEQLEEGEKTDENSQNYTEEIYVMTKESENVDDPSAAADVKMVKPKKQRGRKPISDIPLHVLGRDITKPSEGVSNGGRTMPKPRLGVKVPYRNLTSQIVSKEEIEKEIMERFKMKQEQNMANSGDILFARKLTQRLAKKLTPSEKDKTGTSQDGNMPTLVAAQNEKPEIKNNSDLIAILEGADDDINLNKKPSQNDVIAMNKMTEKEIALQQLKELPLKSGKSYEEKKTVTTPKPVIPQKEVAKPKPSPQKSTAEKEKKPQVDVEPRLTGMVIKTYTRKRKSIDLEPILPLKKSVVATAIKSEDGGPPTNVYITKSSRVIKRKVIWDPDEVPTKSPIRSPTSSKPSPTKTPTKTTERKEPVEKKTEKKEIVEKPQEKKESPVKKSPVVSKSPPMKKPKRLTEVDKLLMDEGAVNMLYDVTNNDEPSPKKKSNKSVISLDKAHKELMSKASVIKNDLQQNTSKEGQKTLRKKEIVTPPKKDDRKEVMPSTVTRKKSKDSARSSVHSPPPYNTAEASRIIRRHSSSSFSSNDELDEEDVEERVTRKRGAAVEAEENSEERVTRKKAAVAETPKKKLKKSNEKLVKNNNNVTDSPKVNHVDKTSQYKSFTVTKKNKLVSISLTSVDSKVYLSEQLLKEVTSCLKQFGSDDNCHVVSITSDSSESFCEGLDYNLLIADDDGARKKKATELASLVKEFLRCLLHFPKVLVAGIQGDCVGLGVTMLPLFDMVIASDTSTFSTPYSKLGCVPEAGFLLTVPHLNSNGLASELLFASQTVKADSAFRRGLVTRLCWPEKYQQELKTILSQISSQSKQSIVATKQQLRQNMLQSTETALSAVNKVLVENWTSPECQKNFSK